MFIQLSDASFYTSHFIAVIDDIGMFNHEQGYKSRIFLDNGVSFFTKDDRNDIEKCLLKMEGV